MPKKNIKPICLLDKLNFQIMVFFSNVNSKNSNPKSQDKFKMGWSVIGKRIKKILCNI